MSRVLLEFEGNIVYSMPYTAMILVAMGHLRGTMKTIDLINP